MLPVAQHMVGNYTSAHTNSCDIYKFLKRVLFCLTQIDFGLHLCKKAKEVVYKKKPVMKYLKIFHLNIVPVQYCVSSKICHVHFAQLY